MPTTTAMVTMFQRQQQQPSKPITIPGHQSPPVQPQQEQQVSYREIIKQLAAQQTTKPYGDIPPMLNKRNKKKRPKTIRKSPDEEETITVRQKTMRRMSHVEDWIVVDSKESLPDEEELVQSPLRNFLSADFFTQVLPLHMPPPSLSEKEDGDNDKGRLMLVETADDELEDSEEDSEEEEEEMSSTSWKGERDYKTITTVNKTSFSNITKDLLRRHSVSSFHHNTNNKSSPTSSTTTASYAVSSSPPHLSNTDHELWKATIAKLKRTLIVSPPASPPPHPVTILASVPPPVVVRPPSPSVTVPIKVSITKQSPVSNKKRMNKFIPMPIPPRRPISQKRRSEATTQPRFNPDTNTYTRDTRSNPDHLRMISAELNMMRGRKLLSPLKPRGFLPRRKDAFIRGLNRKPSHLIQEVVLII